MAFMIYLFISFFLLFSGGCAPTVGYSTLINILLIVSLNFRFAKHFQTMRLQNTLELQTVCVRRHKVIRSTFHSVMRECFKEFSAETYTKKYTLNHSLTIYSRKSN